MDYIFNAMAKFIMLSTPFTYLKEPLTFIWLSKDSSLEVKSTVNACLSLRKMYLKKI